MMLGERLKKLRGRRTQHEIAELLGMARTSLTQYESGKVEPNIETLKKLAEIYGVSVDYLITGKETHNYEIKEQEEMKVFESPEQFKAFKESVSDPNDDFFVSMYLNASDDDKKRLRDFFVKEIWGKK